MTQVAVSTDLVAEVRRILEASEEPLTLPRLRERLPAPFRGMSAEELGDALRRQVAADVLYQFPKYRSAHDRFWDRPMAEHVRGLLRQALREQPLPWSELRRKLPAYAQTQAEGMLEEEVAHGRIFRYPRSGRGGERFGVRPPDPKEFLRPELVRVFQRLEQMGFGQNQLREAAIELLHEEEWSSVPPVATNVPSVSPTDVPSEHRPEPVEA